MGGQNTAAQPVEHLLTAWAGCTQATALFVARQMRLRLERLEFEDIVAQRDERGALSLPIQDDPAYPSRLHTFSGTIRVFCSKQLSAEDLEMLRHQTELRCPVANMILASGCLVNVEWVDGNAST